MIKYSVYEENFEFHGDYRQTGLTERDIIDLYQGLSFTAPILLGSFDTLDEARATLKTVCPATYHSDAARGGLAVGRLGYIAEEEYDEDGEFDQCSTIWDYAVEPMEAADGI